MIFECIYYILHWLLIALIAFWGAPGLCGAPLGPPWELREALWGSFGAPQDPPGSSVGLVRSSLGVPCQLCVTP